MEERAVAAARAGWQVVLHDYRDVRFLKQVTAAGVFGTLMSSSALSYAISLNWTPAACGGLALQTAAAALALVAYLRTYVARATLDPRRGNLEITCCSFFGEPLATEHQIPLAMLEPGYNLDDSSYIKFRTKGSAWNPGRWVWYRLPRATAADGSEAKPGAQVGYRFPARAEEEPPATAAAAPGTASAAGSTSARRRFPGAGLGAETADAASAASGPRAPSMAGRTGGATGERRAADSAPRKTLAGLRLHGGLPLNASEEQKLLDFFSEPMAYASSMQP